ncbi:DNA-binding MarR family transcriptional regulator [Paenibacillus rhizosphaerae]|uniref:DNA-binding MarR family transcriptional regulator n=1 Tax=Paenibacillus rhizosphaerae TaxID=297318 RepID=A0A839TVC8_9BACL|nr:MarR family transcriptional regulator [Paenibacillus rhizosphaerae]MBB3130461.1 DNA-binding MarR family transcriptional regulator [Paenibacillus rhizosphaerae]
MDPQEEILELLYSFRQVNLTFYQIFWKQADALETTWIQYLVLHTLREHPDIGLSELADLILMGNSATSGVVHRLVKAGLVERRRLETDRRSIALRITEKGDELRKQTKQISMGCLMPLLQIKQEDRSHLLATHQQIIRIFSQKGERERNYE